MKFTTIFAAGLLALTHGTSASPAEIAIRPVLIDTPPTAEPGTSPFPTSLTFDTTAASSFVSAVSSYISSESVALSSLISSLVEGATQTPAPSSSVTTATATSSSATAATTPTTTTATSTSSATATGAAIRNQSLIDISFVASIVLGSMVVLL
ncbi:hypothetical protein V8B97DRAFT_2011964 [Scleroderma yunnanense]